MSPKTFLSLGKEYPETRPHSSDGVAAGVIPLCLVPPEGGVLAAPRSARLAIPSVGDLDFSLVSDEPVALCTCEAVRLVETDFITTSTMIV